MRRLRFLYLILLLCIFSVVVLVGETPWAAEEKFPSRPIQIVVPYPPGGNADMQTRALAPAIERILKQPIIVVNKTGGGAVGAQLVMNKRADGYTALIAMPSFFTVPLVDDLFGRRPKYKVEQFTPIARLSADPLVLVAHPARPWKSVAELVADAKRRPGEITYCSSGVYGGLHLPIEIFAAAEGIKLRHVPFPGAGPGVTALLGGHVDILASGLGPVLPHLKAGALRALATWGNRRLPTFPEIPTLKELGYDIEYYLPVGMVALKETPPAVLQVLRDAVRQAVRNPEFEEVMTKMGTAVAYLDADEYLALWAREAKVVSEVLKRIGKIE